MSNEYLNGGKVIKAGSRVFLTVTAVTIIGILSVSGAYAWNETHLQRLKAIRACPDCDLTGADLKNAYLSNADLSGANLDGAIWTDGMKKCKVGSIGECK